LLELLLACHARIRSFVSLAHDVGSRVDAPEDKVVDGCLRVERYFAEALPLHVADEEESLLPRLRGQAPDVDVALQKMHDQHAQHGPKLRALQRASSFLREAPHNPERRAALAAVADDLAHDFDEHLELEETVIFPAIHRLLSTTTQATIVEELRGRRSGCLHDRQDG
jgi:iron-sulfur cluster repair protein YtfE (RIC family)